MFGCTSQTQCMFVGQQGNLNNCDDDRYRIKKVQSPKAISDRGSMEIVTTYPLFFAFWKIIKSFSFPIKLLLFRSWSAVGVQAHHRWIFGGELCEMLLLCKWLSRVE